MNKTINERIFLAQLFYKIANICRSDHSNQTISKQMTMIRVSEHEQLTDLDLSTELIR